MMKSPRSFLAMSIFVGLVMAIWGLLLGSEAIFSICFGLTIVLTLAWWGASLLAIVKTPVDLVPRRYRPRLTDAGRWVDAPVAELDKSTFGKLLASRMRREPGLHVVVRSQAPPACSDALYDPEVDGRDPAP